MFWITNRYQNYSVIDTKTKYTGGDIGGYLKPGQRYYFSITAVYTDAKVAGNAIGLVYPDCGSQTPTTTTIKPTTTCTTKPTVTCTTRPTTTCTTKPVTTTTTKPPCTCTAPHVSGTAGTSSIRLDWDRITDPEFQGYKVVISKNNPEPSYPDDGYMYWITDRNQSFSVIDAGTAYHGGDVGGNIRPGQEYYFSVTAVYASDTVPGNVVRMTFPGSER